MPKRREMQEFRITELSAVDRPAQAHAKMAIMKRHSDDDTDDDFNKGDSDMPDNATVEGLQKQVDELTKKLADAEFLSKMDDKAKAYFESLSDEDKKKARKGKPEEVVIAAAKAAETDEVLKLDNGAEIRKSAIGEAQFAIFKQQCDEMAAIKKRAEADREALARATFEKRAEDELHHLPGDTASKGAVLKAIDGLSEDIKKTLDTMLKAGEKAIVSAFNSIGVKGEQARKAAGDFNKRVDEIAARDKLSRTAALQKARKEYPEEFKVYQDLDNNPSN